MFYLKDWLLCDHADVKSWTELNIFVYHKALKFKAVYTAAMTKHFLVLRILYSEKAKICVFGYKCEFQKIENPQQSPTAKTAEIIKVGRKKSSTNIQCRNFKRYELM